jgi:uncharacterized protein (DUF1330 family)
MSAPAYLVAHIEVHDPVAFEEYRTRVVPVIEAFGGRYLVRGGALETMEGAEQRRRLVILEFPSMDAARGFYHSPEYAPVLQKRLSSAASDVILVEGYKPG